MKKTISITFLDSAALWETIDGFCATSNPSITRSEFIRFAVREFLTAKLPESGTQSTGKTGLKSAEKPLEA